MAVFLFIYHCCYEHAVAMQLRECIIVFSVLPLTIQPSNLPHPL